MNTLPAGPHGGDWRKLAVWSGRNPQEILDFSVNVRPGGPPDWLRGALLASLDTVARYPLPHAEQAAEAAAAHHGVGPDNIVLGNGCNELIHSITFVAGAKEALIVLPAFSEYELACTKAGLAVHPWLTDPGNGFAPDWSRLEQAAPAGGMVFLGSPGNPSGALPERRRLLAAVQSRKDVLWIIDESFVDYAGEEFSLVRQAAQLPNLVTLRSLTKFYGLAGVRCGYAVTHSRLGARWREWLPAWNVNTFASAAALAVFADRTGFADEERSDNAARREVFSEALRRTPGVEVFPSAANYVLLRVPGAPGDLQETCLKRHGIALRDCSNYRSLETGGWFRAAVRSRADNARFVEALADCLEECRPRPGAPFLARPRRVPALMLQGTSSDAGKSVLASAFCRILQQDGYDVAPFKAQNMALNSGVTALGEEMGRAQIVQAAACRLDPDARMNPVLLKPHSDTGAQVVVLGHPAGNRSARDFMSTKKDLWPIVCKAYDSLAAEHEVMVLEGAGSPGEINLKDADIVNMNMARYAQASVLLAGDIDRGGVYASFLGTWLTMEHWEKSLLAGFLVNRFRGDASLLVPAHDYVRRMTGVPVLGVVPMLGSLQLPEEDRASLAWEAVSPHPEEDRLDVAVVMPGHVSNYTDFAPLAAEPDVRLRPVREAREWGKPDLVILPGSKNVVSDFIRWRRAGLADAVLAHARAGKWVLGVCGGLQMLGRTMLDPQHVETRQESCPMLGLLDLETTLAPEKTLARVVGARTPLGIPTGGFEIHHGVTRTGEGCEELFFRPDGSACGYGRGRIWATYLHGLFDDDTFRRALIDRVRTDSGLAPAGRVLARYDLEPQLDRLADCVRAAVDVQAVYRSMGL